MDKAKLFSQAEKFLAKAQHEKALEFFEQVLRVDPFDSKALSRASDIYLKIGKNEKGVETLRKLAEAFTREGFFTRAVAIYKRVLKIENVGTKQDMIQVHEKLADLYGHLNLVSDAMAHFSIVVDHYDRSMDQNALLNVLKKVSDLDPYNIDSQLKLAELFYAQQRNPEAEGALSKLVENVRSRGHMPDVVRVHERWVELNPQDIKALSALIRTYLEVNEPKKALGRIQLAFRADPRNVLVLELLSETFLNLKQPEKSKAVDTELIKIYREAGDLVRAQEVERRLRGEGTVPTPQGAPSVASEADISAVEEREGPQCPIPEAEFTHDERKVLAEGDVYLKYGLVDKTYELLKSHLQAQSKSIVLRWKLKELAVEKQDYDFAIHVLNEIVLLARAAKKTDLEASVSEELKTLDPQSLALENPQSQPKTSIPDTDIVSGIQFDEPSVSDVSFGREGTDMKEIDLNDFDSSDISIVIDERDLSSASPKAQVQETVIDMIAEESGSGPVLELDMAPEMPAASSEEKVEVDPELSQSNFELSEEVSAPIDDESVALLTEDDFSQEELAQLSKNFQPEVEEDAEVAVLAPPAASSDAPVEVDPEFEIKQSLEEIEFLKAQGLEEEAESLMDSLKSRYPAHQFSIQQSVAAASAAEKVAEAIESKTAELEALGRKVKLSVQEDRREAAAGDFFDLAGDLDAELASEKPVEESVSPASVRDVFNAFKQGVSQSISEEDWQTHFDLGVAYREMGLLDDAVQSFEIVGKSQTQRASALYQIGLCEVAKGQLQRAREKFDEALHLPDLMGQEKISITYELADVLLRLNKTDEAKKLFKEVQKVDPEFREVTEKIKSLGSQSSSR